MSNSPFLPVFDCVLFVCLYVAASVAIDVISKDITGKTLPDQSGTRHVTVGKVSYRVYKLVS
jgi:hypothetical protein